jgi:hypothetical protein
MQSPIQLHPDVQEVLAGLAASEAGVPEARALPAKAYTSEAFYAFEREAVFMHSWLCVGRAQQIPNPGDYIAKTLVGEHILVVRDKSGAVRAMSALCRHRGHPLVEAVGAVRGGRDGHREGGQVLVGRDQLDARHRRAPGHRLERRPHRIEEPVMHRG